MKIVLFETFIWENIKEVSLNKFAHDIPVGIFTNRQRTQISTNSPKNDISYIIPRLYTEPYDALISDYNGSLYMATQEEAILWNSSFIFDEEILSSLERESALVSEEGIWVALKTSNLRDTLRDSLYKEILPQEIPSKVVVSVPIRSYEDLIKGVQYTIEKDIESYLKSHPELKEIEKDVFVHPSATIRRPVDFDTTQGKIIVEADTKVTAFTLIEGPVFIGKNCLITKAFLRPKTAIGKECRVGGELSLSTMCPYSNKSHDGCIALSYIGSWVNLGAGTECATLKYTYTNVSFEINSNKIPTTMIGCGTIFGDWVSTGVGTILSPASILGLGSIMHTPFLPTPKYLPPFSWGTQGEKWDILKWLEVAKIKKSRRSKILTPTMIAFYQKSYHFLDNKK